MASVLSEVDYFPIDSMTRGYHIYKDVWSNFIGEVLYCCRDVATQPPRSFCYSYAVFPLMEANLATFALYSGVNFMYERFLFGSLASATAFKISLFASTIDAVAR